MDFVLASASASDSSQAALLVKPRLLALRPEEAPIAELSQYPRTLHRRLEALQKSFRVFAFPQTYISQKHPPER